ncbi:hypothetical protein BDF19DRAFT_464180 [Syncephalis fuscata]|nr:hypothetical protein BDF19DRAFT_464180 [Syncephalis fuscata]
MDPALLTDDDSPIKPKWLPYTQATSSDVPSTNQYTNNTLTVQQRLQAHSSSLVEGSIAQGILSVNETMHEQHNSTKESTASNGNSNGIQASPLPGLMAATHARHEAICAHLHHAFQTGAFSDLVYSPTSRRSNITKEGLCLALAHLYSAGALHRLTVANARSVLAAAWWLGLEDLCASAAAVCQADIRADTVGIYVEFVENSNFDPDELVGLSPEITSNDIQPPSRSSAAAAHTATDRYGVYSRAIRDAVIREALLRTLATLRFAWFKRLIESNRFRCGTDMERHQLAKEAVQRRKQARTGQLGSDREESVILAFGAMGRERVLWRVPAMNGLPSGHYAANVAYPHGPSAQP